MQVKEIYHSILGESSRAGNPAVIVRLSGCNLRCHYCDTTYAYEGGEEHTIPEIVRQVETPGLPLVLLTGGEPLFQDDTPGLITSLLDAGLVVLVETNGSLPISGVDRRAVIILDQKCPGSGMSDRMDNTNLDRIREKDELKFVLSDRNDYRFALERIRAHSLLRRCPITFSPVHGVLPPRELARWILDDRIPVRLGVQLHRYIGVR